mgnify:CR=1 FL=1
MTTASISKANDILARFGQDQVPLIGFCQPSIEAISDEHCEIKIPLNNVNRKILIYTSCGESKSTSYYTK